MLKNLGKTILAIALLGIIATPIWAADYSTMSNEELSRVRGSLQNVSQEERDALRMEWQSRLQNMTVEERQQYIGKRPANGVGDGTGMGQGRGKGRGMGRQGQ